MALIVIYKYLSKRNNKTNCKISILSLNHDFFPLSTELIRMYSYNQQIRILSYQR